MAVIHVLDKHTAELIAAGEVVERPASVVKELLENAIDAGATQITVFIESGGVKLIEVSDNGCGIEPDDLPTAFIRHATSKIATEDDLSSIHTLGFRGEALASIASVSRVEMLTRPRQADYAMLYRIHGGEEQLAEPAARAAGTTIRVRDLFYNTPARMKFLKKDASEGSFVADIVAHIALSRPEISFKFVREGKLQYVTPGDGDLKNAVYAVLGREFSRGLLPVDYRSSCYRVYGLVTSPGSCRASRSMQYFYINERYVRNRTMMAGMETAFKGTTMQGKFPGAVLLLSLPADQVDVNVHPAKTEVRFAHENDVFNTVYHAVKQALESPGSGERSFAFEGAAKAEKDAVSAGTQQALPAQGENNHEDSREDSVKKDNFTGLSAVVAGQSEPGVLPGAPQEPAPKRMWADTDTAAFWDAPLRESMPLHSSPQPKKDGFRPAGSESGLDIHPAAEAPLFAPPASRSPQPPRADVAETAQDAAYIQPVQTVLDGAEEEEHLHYVGEAFKTYIIAQRGDELCLIDKHAAHERQLYEALAAGYHNVPSQLLLSPLVISLPAEEKQALLDNIPLLENVGIELSDFGGGSVLLRAVPADIEQAGLEDMLVEIAAKLARGSRDALSERTEWVLHSISCKAAVKAGDRNSPQELMALAEKILSGAVPPFCPHGRPCVLKLSRKELEKQFGRIE